MAITGDGFSVEPDTLRAYARGCRASADEVRDATSTMPTGDDPVAGLGPIARETGFTAALVAANGRFCTGAEAVAAALDRTAEAVTGVAGTYEANEAANRAALEASGPGL